MDEGVAQLFVLSINNRKVIRTVGSLQFDVIKHRLENEYGAKVSTIEHLMGALFGLGIDNALIEINNEEVPILDGSAKVFIEKILTSGIKISESLIKIIKINKEIALDPPSLFCLWDSFSNQ